MILKDKDGADVTFTRTGTTADGVVYDSRGSSLLDTKRLTFRLVETKATNRIHVKLSVPSVCASSVDCAVPEVKYTQVASGDITVVRFASEDDRNNLAAFLKSIYALPEVSSMIVNAVIPQ